MTLFLFIILIGIVNTNSAAESLTYANQTIKGTFASDDCSSAISTVIVPSRVTACSKELYIYYTCNHIEKMGFLDKTLKIYSTSDPISCSNETIAYIENEEFIITKLNFEVKIEFKGNFNMGNLKKILYKFVDDASDYCYIGFISILISCIVLLVVMKVKKSNKNYDFKFSGPNEEEVLNSISTSSIRSKFTKPGTTGGAPCAKRVVNNKASISKRKNPGTSSSAKRAKYNLRVYQSNAQVAREKRCGCSKGNVVCCSQNCSCVKSKKDCTELCHNNKRVNCCNQTIILN